MSGIVSSSWQRASRVLSIPAARRAGASEQRRRLLQRGGRKAAGDGAPPASPTAGVKGLRRRRDHDLGAAARLLRVVSNEDGYPSTCPEHPRAWLADVGVLDAWVVERQGELLGHVAVSRVGTDPVSALRWREVMGRDPSDLGGVSRMYVRARVRREGIGSALLDAAVTDIRRRGLVPVLDVVSVNDAAVRLYEDRGWRLVGMFPWGDRAERQQLFYYAAPTE
jgi:GNAT superfamily N-acetyltransferase